MSVKTLYFDCQCGVESYVAEEDGKLVECSFESQENANLIGNIYKGKVTNILNGMQAAFVNCGLERNCYISVENLYPDHTKYDGGEIDIPATLNLNVGDEIMVQITKAPVANKGAKVTTNITFVGNYGIYMPTTPFIGVSRKITDEETRQILIDTATNAVMDDEGVIIRTAAPFAKKEQLVGELGYVRTLYAKIKENFAVAQVGDLLYAEMPLYVRVLRDEGFKELGEVHVGTRELYKHVNNILGLSPNAGKVPVVLHDDGKDMLFDAGLSEQLIGLMQPRVDLPNGGYLIIEHTEALTSIDVNTGSFTGAKSLEETVFYTNILAAKEIARQVKLRNLGGIFIVDFIDMTDEEHQQSIVEILERELAKDKSRCHVLPMSKFGLVEFTRKRAGTPPANLMTKPCKHCHNAGYTRSSEFILFDFRAKLFDILAKGSNKVFIDMNYNIAQRLLNWQAMTDGIRSSYPSAKIYITPHRSYSEESLIFRADDNATPDEKALLLY
jgi:ribonuclease G